MMIHVSTHWMKFLPFILVGLGFLLAVWYVFKRDVLLKFVVDSMTTDGKPDSKKLSGFAFVSALILGFFICIYYSDKHEPPEYYVLTIAGLVASFYGIREVGRFVTTKYGGNGNGNGETTPPPTQAPVPEIKPAHTPASAMPGGDPKKNDDIG